MYYGWLQDSIRDLVESYWRVFRDAPYALVTCIDSSDDVRSLTTSRAIVQLEESSDFLDSSLLFSGGKIIDLARRYDLFNGFDEIWLYRKRPVVGKPHGFSIVSPLDLNTERPPGELLDWFTTSGCVLGLGDGIGMNYLTDSKDLVEWLNSRQREFDLGGEG